MQSYFTNCTSTSGTNYLELELYRFVVEEPNRLDQTYTGGPKDADLTDGKKCRGTRFGARSKPPSPSLPPHLLPPLLDALEAVHVPAVHEDSEAVPDLLEAHAALRPSRLSPPVAQRVAARGREARGKHDDRVTC